MDKHEGRDAGTIRLDDPWYDALAVGWGEGAGAGVGEGPGGSAGEGAETSPPRSGPGGPHVPGASDIYLEVQRSAAFQDVRSRYRRFVVPATAGFFLWYVAYVIAATTAPAMMARPVVGSVNVALLAGLGQFLSTFLLTWAYARHARLRRDRAALDLRWTVFEQEQVRRADVGERTRARGAGR
ncbi:DUF485 domain-containing protein [Streptomyces sp. ISL-43]|uniref:DUF485 domain-containing protein n=1 Tax=Streptomyces sp. ISL-43 TaxID=2819183 RepID=UPI001BE9289E|nr:DUF485 domain-containing protein [Streptomyces sp. ISL-43]MBT2450327.1 DUF485 domain-containing protein [Streptomyces sp. ISL-43]